MQSAKVEIADLYVEEYLYTVRMSWRSCQRREIGGMLPQPPVELCFCIQLLSTILVFAQCFYPLVISVWKKITKVNLGFPLLLFQARKCTL